MLGRGMDLSKPIPISFYRTPPTSAVSLLSKSTSKNKSLPDTLVESDLLRSIRATLHGLRSQSNEKSQIRSSLYWSDDLCAEEELAWDAYTLVVSSGGVIRKKWDFTEGRQRIQWACIGHIDQPASIVAISSTSPARYTSDLHAGPPPPKDPSERPSFGPFATIQQEPKRDVELGSRPRAIYVFFRNMGKVFLANGIEYTFNLPFVARKAWPVFPHGVIIQRILDPTEIEEANLSGDPPLPTIFSFTNPFAEVTAIGLINHIYGGFRQLPVSLRPLDALDTSSPSDHERIPPHEVVVWVSQRGPYTSDDVILTLDLETRVMTVWRYAYVKPQEKPAVREGLEAAVDNDDPPTVGLHTASDLEMERLHPLFWFERLYQFDAPAKDCSTWQNISASIFDLRWDRKCERSLFAICFPATKSVSMMSIARQDDGTLKVDPMSTLPALSVAPIRATRLTVLDLLLVKPNNTLVLLTHGLREIRLKPEIPLEVKGDLMSIDGFPSREIVSVSDPCGSSISAVFGDGSSARASINLAPQDDLTHRCFQILAMALPTELAFSLRLKFLHLWSERGLSTAENVEFHCFSESLYSLFNVGGYRELSSSSSWQDLSRSISHQEFREDVALKGLWLPANHTYPAFTKHSTRKPHSLLGAVLNGLHSLAEEIRMSINQQHSLFRLVPVICRIALIIRPEWADYWKRFCPDAFAGWSTPDFKPEYLDERLPQWPPDMSAILYGRLSNPEWNVPWMQSYRLAAQHKVAPSLEYGRLEPLARLRQLTSVFMALSDNKITDSRKRAENALHLMVKSQIGPDFLRILPIGIAAPLREAIRTCQLSPSGEWPVGAYQLTGRNDLAEGIGSSPDHLANSGYRTVKEWLNSSQQRSTFGELIHGTIVAAAVSVGATVSGVELDLENFTTIRFGQDKRIEEVARMLCSSTIPPIKMMERPELNEHDITKEQQLQVVRLAERTLALPLGRAMFTFGSVARVTRDAYTIPKMEFALYLQPQNVVVYPEPGKIPFECLWWGDFHNGVAAGLRISQSSKAVDSSWIKFNKPMELTPEHAGFLYALGLTGHLKEMLTWNTFGYLTPKHDMTSIAVLLGLSAANVGSGNRHVAKLIAVHTPSMLPTPSVDLNVSLITQAASLVGLGLLYMGSKRRHTADLCLTQLSRKDLVQPDLSNEHREAYTLAAALSFGMVVLGKGSSIPADIQLVERLRILIHGEGPLAKQDNPSFDINLTSPAASIALGLMYLRTNRRDIAEILTIPDTPLGLNRIQPHFLLIRTLARALINFSAIEPNNEWLSAQIPPPIADAIHSRFQGQVIDDAFELAHYNIIAGACFAIALKYAGTAREEAYLLIIGYYDQFSRLAYHNGPGFDHRIRRAAIRDGLNLISISVNMVMAGTGEINCLRRLRYAYGMYNQPIRYGTHMATYMSLGLLFLGGGRFTLGTSDAAIACMVTAFFPRFPQVSSENKSYLQALRHLWVLAVEPRCLVARDVDTKEIVYLPVKIKVRDGKDVGTTQLISPTLIPDLDKLSSIRVDTPRYWPFYLDIANFPRHKQSLLHSQTLFVKRRTAFLSYMEDPKGSRSLFVRTGSSTSDAATLDFPKLRDAKVHPASDLYQFISSSSNDPLFLSFADHLCREDSETDEESLFRAYCHAALLDSILQDKPQTLQSHLTMYRYRTMSHTSRYFNLRLEDLRYVADFYGKVYERRFSGRTENNPRPPLVRENTALGALHALDDALDVVRKNPEFLAVLKSYVRGDQVIFPSGESPVVSKQLAWYLQQNNVPPSNVLVVLRDLASKAHEQCVRAPEPDGTTDLVTLDEGIKEVLHITAAGLVFMLGQGWSVRSLNEVLSLWN